MKNKMKWTSLMMVSLLAMMAVACQEENLQQGAEEGLPATIRLNVVPDAASQAQTRADENTIRDLHVLVYNASGELIGWNYGTSSTLAVNTRSGSGCTLYAIANTGNEALFSGGVASTETKLKALKTATLGAWGGLTTASHLVMVGSKTGVAISAGSSTLQGGMTVTRMVAKVTLNIGVKAGSGITIKDYQVCSLPKQSYYVPDMADGATAWIDGVSTQVNAASVSKTFFMYENRRGVVGSITAQKDKDENRAPKNATYVVINGGTPDYKATWWVYLGENETSDFNMKRNSRYTYTITLNRPGDVDTRVEVEELLCAIKGGNSNCYMVKPGATVAIPVERANESFIELDGSTYSPASKTYHQLRPKETWTASIVWQSSVGVVSLSDNSGTGPLGAFKVTGHLTTAEPNGGNAVVAIKNSSNQILWSWHIWVTAYEGSTRFTNNNGKRDFIFMDRALGATSATPGELTSCGLMYQWGRKDPFPGIGQQGGSWSVGNNTDPVRVYNASGALYEIIKTAVPSVTPNNLTNAIRQPDTFYYNNAAPKDWFVYDSSSSQNNDLWSGGDTNQPVVPKKSVFDPCPKGWRVPPCLDGVSPFENIGNLLSWDTNSRGLKGDTGYFPAAGHRLADGFLGVAGGGGYYSLGTSLSTSNSFFYFYSVGITPFNACPRGYGLPIRCCQDNLNESP